MDQYQICYEKMLVGLGISLDMCPKDRGERLLAVDTSTVAAAMVPVFVTSVITMALCDDGVLIPGSIPSAQQYNKFKVPSWCPEIMMGDGRNGCIIWNKAWDKLSDTRMSATDDLSTPTANNLLVKMDSYLGLEKAKVIAEFYRIKSGLSPKETFDVIERFTSHGLYPTLHYFAELASPSVYSWHFDVPSPYDNAWNSSCTPFPG